MVPVHDSKPQVASTCPKLKIPVQLESSPPHKPQSSIILLEQSHRSPASIPK